MTSILADPGMRGTSKSFFRSDRAAKDSHPLSIATGSNERES